MYYKEQLLKELKKQFPSTESVVAEIASLSARLTLPKGTEHFMSDIHGAHEALSHICRNASGVIKRKIDLLFSEEMTEDERAELAAIIYYPEEKLHCTEFDESLTIKRLTAILLLLCKKYTHSDVKMRLADACKDYFELIFELLSADASESRAIISTLVRMRETEGFISALARGIRALVISRVHIVGDIFDRGARADVVLDELMRLPSVDIEWGNHDALWLGAAAGSSACVATAVANCLAYGNTEILEHGYGISLSPLMRLAERYYSDSDASAFAPKPSTSSSYADRVLLSRMHKAVSVIRYKLEGELILRHPEYLMDGHALLHRIDYSSGCIDIDGVLYALKDGKFPTVSPTSPYDLIPDEQDAIDRLTRSFCESEKLKRHARFLLAHGSIYKIYNRNLLFHGSVPLDNDHSFLKLLAVGGLYGKALMDECDLRVRAAFSDADADRDFLWFLWCGKNSPLFARDKMTSLERILIEDKGAHRETKNSYYDVWEDESIALRILDEFSLPHHSHIINGHVPVKPDESPIKAGGRVIVIDGGFCSAGEGDVRAGYTLIYNSDGMRIVSHRPFCGKAAAIERNLDIDYEITIFEEKSRKILLRDVDAGDRIRERISILLELYNSYKKSEKQK